MQIDERGKITPLKTVDELSQHLMAVKTPETARVAAAAALSLHHSGRVGPGTVSADKVTVRRTKDGLLCTAQPSRFFRGTVLFDEKGRINRISKAYTGPLPP